MRFDGVPLRRDYLVLRGDGKSDCTVRELEVKLSITVFAVAYRLEISTRLNRNSLLKLCCRLTGLDTARSLAWVQSNVAPKVQLLTRTIEPTVLGRSYMRVNVQVDDF